MEKQNILDQVRKYVKTEMEENDPAHDGAHVDRVLQLTKKLCGVYPEADSYRAQLLALVHDMQDDKLSSNRDKGSLKEALLTLGVDEEDAEFVLSGIPYISYRKHPKLGPEVALEIRIVQDSDRIDAMGAIGIGRTFAFGGAKGRPMEESIQHFEDKLLKLYDLLSTEGGKTMALPRHKLLTEFYRAYREEQGTSAGTE